MVGCSGKFVLRLPPHLHQLLSTEANKHSQSLNTYCQHILESRFQKETESLSPIKGWDTLYKDISTHFGNELEGIILFGSQVTGKATESSDTDLFIVLSPSVKITRQLYTWWDDDVLADTTISPHFVSYPDSNAPIGGLWCEVALSGKILYQKSNHMSIVLKKINTLVQNGAVRRYWANGHPYWIWRKDEKSHTGT